MFLHRSPAAGSHRCGRQPSRAPTELVCACRESTTATALPNKGSSPAPGPRGNRQPEPTAATVCSETSPGQAGTTCSRMQEEVQGCHDRPKFATPFCCCYGRPSPSTTCRNAAAAPKRPDPQIGLEGGALLGDISTPLASGRRGLDSGAVQMWKCFDRGVAERESLARFQRRHRKRRAPIRQAPGVDPVFSGRQLVWLGLSGTNGVSSLAVRRRQPSPGPS